MRILLCSAPRRTRIVLLGEAAEVIARDIAFEDTGWRGREEPDSEVEARDAIVGVNVVCEVKRSPRGDGGTVGGRGDCAHRN